MKKTYDKFGKLRTIKEVNKINKYLGYCSKCGEPVEINGNSMADGAFKVKHKVCKQKTDWEKEFDEEFKSLANEYCDPTNDVKDFISKTLQQQREEEKIRVWTMVGDGLEKWSKKAEKYKWIKCDGCNSDDGWYDFGEILSSLLGHCGYFKDFCKPVKFKKENK